MLKMAFKNTISALERKYFTLSNSDGVSGKRVIPQKH
jgi:hypothetical protein